MSNQERPGVYSSYEVTRALYGSGAGRAVGVAGVAEKGQNGEASRVVSDADAAEKFGADSKLTALIKILFENGAASVYAVPIVKEGQTMKSDYETAFAALMNVPEIGYMICDTHMFQAHDALAAALAVADEYSRYRIGIVESAGAAMQLLVCAQSINEERMVLVGVAENTGVQGAAAAAVAGILSGQSDPALPLNGAELAGVTGISGRWSDNEISLLTNGGVTVIECVGSSPRVVRGLTTRTIINGVPDPTWRELTTIQIVDDVVPTIRDSLRTRFARTKNTAQTRGAIRTQVVIELENKRAQEIIEDYSNVTVEPDETDPTICRVSFTFTVAHGLNRIELMAHITV